MSRRIRLLGTALLTAAATACPLHDLTAALEAGRATASPHEWPYAAACAAYANTTEETWCSAGASNAAKGQKVRKQRFGVNWKTLHQSPAQAAGPRG